MPHPAPRETLAGLMRRLMGSTDAPRKPNHADVALTEYRRKKGRK